MPRPKRPEEQDAAAGKKKIVCKLAIQAINFVCYDRQYWHYFNTMSTVANVTPGYLTVTDLLIDTTIPSDVTNDPSFHLSCVTHIKEFTHQYGARFEDLRALFESRHYCDNGQGDKCVKTLFDYNDKSIDSLKVDFSFFVKDGANEYPIPCFVAPVINREKPMIHTLGLTYNDYVRFINRYQQNFQTVTPVLWQQIDENVGVVEQALREKVANPSLKLDEIAVKLLNESVNHEDSMLKTWCG